MKSPEDFGLMTQEEVDYYVSWQAVKNQFPPPVVTHPRIASARQEEIRNMGDEYAAYLRVVDKEAKGPW